MITLTDEDIFSLGADILVNPVNCIGVMGGGLAAEFKRRWPKMFADYRVACRNGILALGVHWLWRDSDTGVRIVCLPTKRDWREDSTLQGVECGLASLSNWLRVWPLGGLKIAIPALGCGLGGLDFEDVWPLMQTYLKELPHDIYVCLPR